MSIVSRAQARLKEYVGKQKAAEADAKKWRRLAANARKVIARNRKSRVPGIVNGWHPKAERVPYSSAGGFVAAAERGVLHTTEGTSLPTYNGSAPHFTFFPKTGRLVQHMPIGVAAKALVHPPQVETNRAHATQIELVAFSDADLARRVGHPEMAVVNFTAADYKRIAGLCRWVEKHAGVPRRSGLSFARGAARLSPRAWLDFAGWCGHMHVPGNAHWDPAGLRIDLIV